MPDKIAKYEQVRSYLFSNCYYLWGKIIYVICDNTMMVMIEMMRMMMRIILIKMMT